MWKLTAVVVLLAVACSGRASEVKENPSPVPTREEGGIAVRVLQAGGVFGRTDSTLMMSEKDLAGTYTLGTGQTENVVLSLSEYGTYSELVNDCVARPISNSGTWRLTEDGVVLQSNGDRRADSPVPARRLMVARDGDALLLVGEEHIAMLLIGSAPRSNCFRRQVASAHRSVTRGS
jgi:hypothetical protein